MLCLSFRSAEIEAGTVAPGACRFALLSLVFGKFFVGVGGGFTRSEHGGRAGGLLLLFLHTSKLVADLAERRFNGFDFDEQVTHLFEEIVEMVWPDNIRQ